MARLLRGRRSVFRHKVGGRRLQGLVTKHAVERFETHRRALAIVADRDVEDLTDADVLEFLIRGDDDTRAYLQRP